MDTIKERQGLNVPLSVISNAPVDRKWVSSMLLRKNAIRHEKICKTQTAFRNDEYAE